MELNALVKIFDFSGYTAYDWVAQILGFCGLACFVVSFVSNKKILILIFQFIGLSFLFANMAMIHAIAGMIMNGIGVVRMAVYLFRDKHKWARNIAWVIGFSLAFIGACIYSWITNDGWPAIFPMVACVIATVAYTLDSPIKIRILVLVANPLWLIYDLYFLNYASALNDIISTGAALIGFLAVDIPTLVKARKAMKAAEETGQNENPEIPEENETVVKEKDA